MTDNDTAQGVSHAGTVKYSALSGLRAAVRSRPQTALPRPPKCPKNDPAGQCGTGGNAHAPATPGRSAPVTPASVADWPS